MNIYEKLQKMRQKLQAMDLKKSGRNNFAKYDYFELADFLPSITNIMLEEKITSFIEFDKEKVTLTIINIEKPDETIIFSSPMATASLKGCHDVQNLGAVITYLRRYLYINAFDIIESDALDRTESQTNNNMQKTTNTSQIQQKTLNKTLDVLSLIEQQTELKEAYQIASKNVKEFSNKEDQNDIWKAYGALKNKLGK